MNNFLDAALFTIQDGESLVRLASMSDHGCSPVDICKLTDDYQAIITRLLNMSQDELNASGISLWGPTGENGKREHIGFRLPVDGFGRALFNKGPSHTLH